MAGSVNKVILVGNLGSDPELKYTDSGVAVLNINLATNESYKDKEGNKQEKVTWHRLVFWRRIAEIMGEYAHKGMTIYIEGRIQTRTYDNAEGVTQYITEVDVRDMQFLSKKDEGATNGRQPVAVAAGDDDDLEF
jgi:single-strand DNA-binding protein